MFIRKNDSLGEMTSMVFSLFGDRLCLLHLCDCGRGGSGECLWRRLCAWIVWGKLLWNVIEKAERDAGVRSNQFYIQSLTKYLRLTLVFTWNSALLERFNFYFDFCYYWQNFHFGRGTAHWGIILWSLDTFLIFPKFLRL